MNNARMKTVIFFGAGSTAPLGMPSTEKQNSIFREFFFGSEESLLKECGSFADEKDLAGFYESAGSYDKLNEFVKHLFIRNTFNLQSLYNIIDISILSGREIGEYSVTEIVELRSEILELLQVFFAICERTVLTEKKDVFLQYQNFFEQSAKLQLKRKGEMITSGCNLQSNDFIFSDVSYISTNWDVLLLWAMMLAHKKLNDTNCDNYPDSSGVFKLKVFNDFYTYLNSVDVNGIDNTYANWFPYNQTVAYRINDSEHPSDKRIFLFPAFLPHGQTHWLHCPKCGKLTMFISKDFEPFCENFPMSKGKSYTCAHCGNNKLNLKNSAMLLQTNFKVKEPYIEMIQRSMRIALKEAERIIFIGYSLPEDDIDYRSLLIEANAHRQKNVYVVLYEKNANNSFIEFDRLPDEKQKGPVQRFANIFEGKNTYVNFAGAPAALDKIIELLNDEKE